MITKVEIDEILDKDEVVFVDVRSEKEFETDTIPGAINLPILNNQEREYVGYLYKQIDKEKAKKIGLNYASNKLTNFYEKAREVSNNNKSIALFCYRGGMRSQSIANVLNTMGIDVYLINGGYKSYRKLVMTQLTLFKDRFQCIVLHGLTGVGKTKILKTLSAMEQPVIDLEYLARNSGSVFGSIGYEQSMTQKKFDSLLLETLKSIQDKYVLVESESKRIGRVIVPEFLFANMQNGCHILIETNMTNRISNIKDEYINISTEDRDGKLIRAIQQLSRKLGKPKVNELIEKVQNKEYAYVIKSLMVDYYDSLYQYSIDKVGKYDKIIKYEHIQDAAKGIIEYINEGSIS